MQAVEQEGEPVRRAAGTAQEGVVEDEQRHDALGFAHRRRQRRLVADPQVAGEENDRTAQSALFLLEGAAQRLVERLGRDPERLGAGGVGDDGRRRQPLDQRARHLRVDRRDQAEPERREPRGDEGDRQLRPVALAHHDRHPVEHRRVAEHVGPADLHLSPRRLRHLGRAAQVLDHRLDPDRLRVCVFSQAGAIITGSRPTR